MGMEDKHVLDGQREIGPRRKGLGRQWPRERGSRGRSGSLRGGRCGAGADSWAGNGLVSEDHAVPRKALRGIVMKPILVNARGAGAAAVRSPLRCCGLPTPLLGSEISRFVSRPLIVGS